MTTSTVPLRVLSNNQTPNIERNHTKVSQLQIKFKKLVPEAKLPTQGKPGDAAYDLYCVEDCSVQPGVTKAISTGLQLADVPAEYKGQGLFLQIEGRSGLALKGIYPLGGIIDSTYRGEIKVILHNGNHTFTLQDASGWMGDKSIQCMVNDANEKQVVSFKAGDRIAQMVVRFIPLDVTMLESEEVTETSRGTSGFGSTGA